MYEVLAFLNVLLESGNTDVQNGLREVMDNKEHPMFHTFQRILKEAATAYTERYTANGELPAQRQIGSAPLSIEPDKSGADLEISEGRFKVDYKGQS